MPHVVTGLAQAGQSQTVTTGNPTRQGASHLITLAAESHPLGMQYRVNAGSTGTVADRRLQVMAR
jgi:hypothetical protein